MAQARQTYDAFAATYDEFNYRYQYERWTGKLERTALASGAGGRRLLDVGCGTGLSFIAMIERGWEVTACDISPGMVERARERAGDRATLLTADMRELPELGEFDLVWAVNDAVNYVLTDGELIAALSGMRANLAPGGVVLFDVNTLDTYRTFFSSEHVVEHDGKRFVWSGLGPRSDAAAGGVYEARVEGDAEGFEAHVHVQRHFGEDEVLAAIEAAGLHCVDLAGELEGELSAGLDEDVHSKAVYVCIADGP